MCIERTQFADGDDLAAAAGLAAATDQQQETTETEQLAAGDQLRDHDRPGGRQVGSTVQHHGVGLGGHQCGRRALEAVGAEQRADDFEVGDRGMRSQRPG